MKKMLSILVLLLLLSPVYSGVSQATLYHFEDYRLDQVKVNAGSSATWTFDLDVDNLSLWDISVVPLKNKGADWELHPDDFGPMDETDELHRAYLTMELCQANGDIANLLLDDVLSNKTLSNGGTRTIDVFTQLYDDHFLKVMITSVSGDYFYVKDMKLAGCYETAPAPVPEPGTLVLLGMGFVLLSVLLRRKVRLAPSKTRR